jgi:hypothetical protein
MRTRAVVTGGAAVVLAVSLSACNKGLKEKTLRFTEKDTNNFGFVDNAPKAKVGPQGPDMLTPGDTLSFSSDVLDASGKDVGDLDATCVTSRGGRSDQASVTCQATYTVPKGQLFLTVGGKGPLGSNSTTGAVVGGTGDYAGATGTFRSVGQNNSKDTFKLFIPS